MTAICGGGDSEPRPGYAATIILSAVAIRDLLAEIPTPWAVALAGYLGLIFYELSSFCDDDPPAVPNITAADALNLITFLDIQGHTTALLKFQQLVAAYAWYQFCQCSAVATPAAPAPPAAPVGLPVINPPVSPPATTTGCYDVTPSVVKSRCEPINVPADSIHYEFQNLLLSAPGPVVHSYGAGNPTSQSRLLPSGATQYELFITTIANGPAVQTNQAGAFYNAAGVGTSPWSYAIPPTGLTVHAGPFAIPANSVAVVQAFRNADFPQDIQFTFELRLYCGSTAPVASQPCCPPDQTLQAQVTSILEYVTLIQRQLSPFAYIRSTVHAGLAGEGHFAVQGLIGCLVQLTAFPSNVGIEDGDPLEYWEAGWINWGNADGSSSRERITVSPQVSLPTSAGQYTRIGYSLPAGVTATITELVREP